MMSGKTHLIADESIGGVQREYVEVERKADVGDYVIIHGEEIEKVVGLVDSHIRGIECADFWVGDGEYKTLEPTDIVHIALDDSPGKRYRLVDRKAEVGEKVLIVDDECSTSHIGHYGTVVDAYSDGISINIGDHINYYPYAFTEDYRVLEPVADAIIASESEPTVDARHASPEVVDLLANLARRVTSLENKLGSVEAQLADTQGNVEKLAQELATKTHEQSELIEMALDDIVTLDERTQPQETPFFSTYQPTIYFNTTTTDKSAEEIAKGLLDELMKIGNFGGVCD